MHGTSESRQSTDGELVLEALESDNGAFAELYRRYWPIAVHLAMKEGLDEPSAQDVAQDSLLAAQRGLSSIRNPEHFGSWLRGIVRKTTAYLFRKRSRETLGGDRASQPEDVLSGLEDRERSERIWAAVDQLPKSERESLFRRYRDGQSISAISAAYGASPDAVYQRIHRGKVALLGPLRRLLGEELQEMIPSERERDARAHSIAVAILASLPDAWLPTPNTTAKGAAAGTQTANGILAVAIGVALMLAVVLGMRGARESGDTTGEEVTVAPRAIDGRLPGSAAAADEAPVADTASKPSVELGEGGQSAPAEPGEPAPEDGERTSGTRAPANPWPPLSPGITSSTGNIPSSSRTIKTSISEALTEQGVSVYGFNILVHGAGLKSVAIEGRGKVLLAGPYQYARDAGVRGVHISLGAAITAHTRRRNLKMQVKIHEKAAWTLELVPTADTRGQEIV